MKLIDTHSHLDTRRFGNDYREVLARSRKAGVIAQVLPGVCCEWWPNLFNLSRREKDLFAAPGLHPLYLSHHLPHHLEKLEAHLQSENPVALGEIGLDYYHQETDHHAQQQLFEAQLKLADTHNLPVLLHVRKAHDQVQATIRRKNFRHGGIVHAFSGSLQQADHYARLGFKIGVGGTITYDRATRIRNVAKSMPLETIVLESDAPDIPPQQHNHERNSPEYLPLVLEALAEIRSESKSVIARATTQNSMEILGLEGILSC